MRPLTAALAALVLAGLWATGTAADNMREHTPIAKRCTAQSFKPFSAAVWRLGAWDRGKPPKRVLEALRARLNCAPAHHRLAMKRTWRRDKAAFYAHRKAMLWRERVTPFYGCTSIGGCGWWPLPAGIVDCESGGNYSWHSGAFGFLDSTWLSRGGGQYAPYPGAASVEAQQIMAHQLWLEVGESGWECKSDGAPHPY